MAFSLEAAIVVPLSLVALTTCLSYALPAYKLAERTCNLTSLAVIIKSGNNSIYNTCLVEYDGSYAPAVHVDPDGIISLYKLGHDLLRPIGEMMMSEE